jgi:hypothetical protein
MVYASELAVDIRTAAGKKMVHASELTEDIRTTKWSMQVN